MTDAAEALLAAVREIGTDLPTPLEISGDFVICGDVHVPYTDWRMALRVAGVARKELKRPRKLIVAGDFWNYDAYSHYPPVMLLPSWQTEKRAGKALAQAWAATFDEIIFLMGNHERRKQKATAGEEDDEDIFSPLASVAKIRSTCYGWATVHSGGQVWRISHPRNYSINQLTTADSLAQKYACNVLSFHEHHLAQGYDRYGRHVIANGGCLVDPDKLGYAVLDDSKSAGMKKGFAMLRAGVLTLYGSEPWTNWSRYD